MVDGITGIYSKLVDEQCVKVQLTSKIAFAFGGGTHSIYYFLVSNPRMVHWLLVECCIRISLSIHGELLDETSSINLGYSKYCVFDGGLIPLTLHVIFLPVNLLVDLIHFHKLSCPSLSNNQLTDDSHPRTVSRYHFLLLTSGIVVHG